MSSFINEISPSSFDEWLGALVGQYQEWSDWEMPPKTSSENAVDYARRVEAEMMVLKGRVGANVIMSANHWVALWVKEVINKGVWMLPRFMQDDRGRSMSSALREWFDQVGLLDAVGVDRSSRIISYLVDVVPEIQRFVKVDDASACLLGDDSGKLSFTAKARYALDAVRQMRRNGGKVSPEAAKVIGGHLNNSLGNAESMRADIEAIGIDMSYGLKHWKPVEMIPAAVFIVAYKDTDKSTGVIVEEPRHDIILCNLTDTEMRIVESRLKGIVDFRLGAGKEDDGKHEEYGGHHSEPV